METGGAAADRNRVSSADAFGKGRLEPLDYRTLGEKITLEHPHDDGIDRRNDRCSERP